MCIHSLHMYIYICIYVHTTIFSMITLLEHFFAILSYNRWTVFNSKNRSVRNRNCRIVVFVMSVYMYLFTSEDGYSYIYIHKCISIYVYNHNNAFNVICIDVFGRFLIYSMIHRVWSKDTMALWAGSIFKSISWSKLIGFCTLGWQSFLHSWVAIIPVVNLLDLALMSGNYSSEPARLVRFWLIT